MSDVPSHAPAAANRRRWTALAFIALAQLMIALDATIVNIALPTVQRALAFSDADRQWAITAYALPFAGLLLLGGRVADRLGRRRAFLVGLAGFAFASAFGGAAATFPMLVAARALQGIFAAILAPTALSLVAVTFTEPRDRAKAFAVYGAIAGSGAAAGLILGGALTQFVDWRFCLYVNVPIALVVGVGGKLLLNETPTQDVGRFDIAGVVLVTGGLVSVVFACTRAVALGWGSLTVLGFFATGLSLLVSFVAQESRAKSPLLPLSLAADRNRGGACIAAALAVVGMYGLFIVLTYYFQIVLSYSPLEAGLAFLPMTLSVLASSGLIASRLLPRVPPRALMAPGLCVAAAGVALLSRIGVESSWLLRILPGEIVVGTGMGCIMVPAFSVATQDVAPRDAGVASAMINTAQQIGGSLGAALLNSIAAGASAAAASTTANPVEALAHGSSVAAKWAAGILVVAALVSAVMIDRERPRMADGGRAARLGKSRS